MKTKDYEPNANKYTLNLICFSSFSQIQLSLVVPKIWILPLFWQKKYLYILSLLYILKIAYSME